MKPIDLQLIGVPERYRDQNPFQLNTEQRLDAYPSLAHASAVNIWMWLQGDRQALPHVAWQDILEEFVRKCQSQGLLPFFLPTDRRNHDEHVRSFLQPRRRRIRDYLDKLPLVTLPVFDAKRTYTRYENSWWLLSELRIKTVSADAMQIGKGLVLDERWIRAFYPRHPGTVTWHRWIQWGVLRVGWTAGSGFSWLWYEIRCPELPGSSGDYRDQNQDQFDKHVDDIWLPLVRNIRWWSTSNPKTWEF